MSQGMPELPEVRKEVWNRVTLTALRGTNYADTPILDFYPAEL